jgi:hypothetical protein
MVVSREWMASCVGQQHNSAFNVEARGKQNGAAQVSPGPRGILGVLELGRKGENWHLPWSGTAEDQISNSKG